MSCESKDCVYTRVKGERFCKHCKKDLLKKMRDDKYLTKSPPTRHGVGDIYVICYTR